MSENAGFARMCARCGVTFIGPSPEAMTLMGDKATAKQTMKKAGVPVVPGSDGLIESVEEAKALAEEIGYPVMVKASAGGGGRGIRRVDRPEDLEDAIVNAKQEAKSFFGDDGVYLEKFIVDPATLKSSCWRTNTATPSTLASGTAPSSAATRRWWRSAPARL